MTLEEAIIFLTPMQRHILADYAFGDSEYHWTNADGDVVAEGYSGRRSYVVINPSEGRGSQYFDTEEVDVLSASMNRGQRSKIDA